MPRVQFLPSGKTVQVPPGTGLLDAARQAGVEIESPCGGEGTCGKCIVRVTSGEVDSRSLGTLPQAGGRRRLCPGLRDAPARRGPDGRSPGAGGLARRQVRSENEAHLVRLELLPRQWEFDPLAVKWLLAGRAAATGKRPVRPRPPHARHPAGLGQTARRILPAGHPQGGRHAARRPGAGDRHHRARLGRLHVINIEPGDTTLRHYAVAIDVGTTTIAVQLIDLAVAQIVAARSDYNDQIACGLDVISRINYARTPERLEELRTRVLGTINRLIHQVAKSRGVDPTEISNAAVSGNTVMTHLLLGLNPEYLRLAPYTPTVLQVPYLRNSEIGIDINPQAWIHFSPCVGSYVGGDITAGILCTDLATDDRGHQPVHRHRHQRRNRAGQQQLPDGLRLLRRPGLRRRRHRMRHARLHRRDREGPGRSGHRRGPLLHRGQRPARAASAVPA